MTCNKFIFTTGAFPWHGSRSLALPVTLDAVLAMTYPKKVELCLFMDPNGNYSDLEGYALDDDVLLTAFVIYHTLSVAIEVARDTETGMVQEPWTVEDVDAQLQWCRDAGWGFVENSLREECRYTRVPECTAKLQDGGA